MSSHHQDPANLIMRVSQTYLSEVFSASLTFAALDPKEDQKSRVALIDSVIVWTEKFLHAMQSVRIIVVNQGKETQ